MDEAKNTTPVAERHPTNERATVEVLGRNGKVFCTMNNLSKTGAFFEILNSNFTPKRGDIVRVTIHLRQINRVYKVNGEVIWAKDLCLGISFIKPADLVNKFRKKI